MELLVPSTMMDVEHVALNMRQEDIDECAAGGLTPFGALRLGYENGICYTMLEPSEDMLPVGMLGVTKINDSDTSGLIWMLGTRHIEVYPMTFLRRCKPALQMLYEESDTELLWNHTYKHNHLHHKWLKWLGFSFLREVGDWYEFARLKG